MRLAAEARMGFYPVSHATIDLICRSLVVDKPAEVTIFDPCCGQGMALEHFGKTLGAPKENLYGIELDDKRAEAAATRVGHVLHSSFFATRIVPVQCYSIAWVNPPYDDELKQNEKPSKQLEATFLEAAARYVKSTGVVILHCPTDRITDEVRSMMNMQCDQVVQLQLPAELRPFREGLLIGRKRPKWYREAAFNYKARTVDKLPEYVVCNGSKPRAYDRVAPTDAEIERLLEKSHLLKPFKASNTKPKLRPILPLGAGHLGLVLASGYLDGNFEPPGYEPHVVRGIAYKEEQLVKCEQTESDDGRVTTTQTTRENIKLKIRAVTAEGVIHEIK